MCDSTNFAYLPDTPDETLVYEYINTIVDKNPGSALKAFFSYFYEGTVLLDEENRHLSKNYRDALKRIISNPKSLSNFPFILNRSIHILWNRWSHQLPKRKALFHLTNRFRHLPETPSRNEFIITLRSEMRAFVSKPQYKALQRRIRLWDDIGAHEYNNTLGDRIKHYHFLYRPTMLTNDLLPEDRENVLAQHRREVYKFEKFLHAFLKHYSTSDGEPVVNTTNLCNSVLAESIQHFAPKRPGGYKNESDDFRAQQDSLKTMGDFKQEFFSYLIKAASIIDGHESLPNNHWAKRLRECIDSVKCDHMGYNQAMITLICKRVLDFLIADSLQQSDSGTFQELTEKEGYLKAIGLLIKISLFRKAITPWLENRFGILYELYETEEVPEIEWLVQAFEHLNVALALNAEDVGYYYTQSSV